MKVAALYDIHGNLPALEAVLSEVESESFDLVVIGGDVFWGPWPGETLASLRALGERAVFVLGNCDRETFSPAPESRFPEADRWVAERAGADAEHAVATWPLTVELAIDELGPVCFCHATARSDTELVTPRTDEATLAATFEPAGAPLVVCGHTHIQFDLAAGSKRLVNAGSVGWGYEGAPGAYWLELGPGIRHRRTAYDYEDAAARIAEIAWPGPLEPSDVITPATRDEAIDAFEAARASESPPPG